MLNLINAYPLYNFLKYCNASNLNKVVLDCGAGGKNPPLSLFYEFGYEVYGIEICNEQLNRARVFCDLKEIDLNIMKGDMTKIPFVDNFFSFLYSYNTTVHMEKEAFNIALLEFNRVLKKDGLCYVNFLTKDCDTYGQGVEVSDGVFKVLEDNQEVLYSHYDEEEIEEKLDGFRIKYKEKRTIQREINGKEYKSSYIDYILIKK